jgi:hypothetical protein
MIDWERWRGLRALVEDAVEHGSSAIERVHLETAARPFAVLEHLPVTATVARGVHVAHDAIASSVYQTIRATNRFVGTATAIAIDIAEALETDEERA